MNLLSKGLIGSVAVAALTVGCATEEEAVELGSTSAALASLSQVFFNDFSSGAYVKHHTSKPCSNSMQPPAELKGGGTTPWWNLDDEVPWVSRQILNVSDKGACADDANAYVNNAGKLVLHVMNDPAGSSTARMQMVTVDETSNCSLMDAMVGFDLRLGTEVADAIQSMSGKMNWFTIMELWEQADPNNADKFNTAGQARWKLNIIKDAGVNAPLKWELVGQSALKHKVNAGSDQYGSWSGNTKWPTFFRVTAPLDQSTIFGNYAKIKVRFARGLDGEGTFQFRIHNQDIFQSALANLPSGMQLHTMSPPGRTYHLRNGGSVTLTHQPIEQWHMMKVYTGTSDKRGVLDLVPGGVKAEYDFFRVWDTGLCE